MKKKIKTLTHRWKCGTLILERSRLARERLAAGLPPLPQAWEGADHLPVFGCPKPQGSSTLPAQADIKLPSQDTNSSKT